MTQQNIYSISRGCHVKLKTDYDNVWKEVWGDMQRYGPVHRHHRRIFFSMLRNIDVNGVSSIAEFGCGEGSNLISVGQQFPHAEIYGFDISHTALERARSHVEGQFSILDIQKEVPKRCFDLSICSDVLEHLEEDVAAIKHIYEVTNGYALFSTVQGRMREFEKQIGHLRNYKRGQLQKMLCSVGFKVEKIIEWGFPLYSPLYRDFLDSGSAEELTHGNYGPIRKALCRLLYGVFLLNSHKHGDVIFVLVKKQEAPIEMNSQI
jgi:2-polyprenyl-3-methyl-5-hydroxy-6-metoxy-1,4-benzoquinol methylase